LLIEVICLCIRGCRELSIRACEHAIELLRKDCELDLAVEILRHSHSFFDPEIANRFLLDVLHSQDINCDIFRQYLSLVTSLIKKLERPLTLAEFEQIINIVKPHLHSMSGIISAFFTTLLNVKLTLEMKNDCFNGLRVMLSSMIIFLD
jgi:hypothetical protein